MKTRILDAIKKYFAMTDDRLNKCPDCGSSVYFVSDVAVDINEHGLHISCPRCGIKTPIFTVLIVDGNQSKAEKDLIDYWNKGKV